MRRAHRFLPNDLNQLEGRLLLTGDVITRSAASVFVGGATPGTPTNKGAVRRISDTLNQAFDNFTNDYLQAQSAFISASSSTQVPSTGAGGVPASSSNDTNLKLFQGFIRQRVSLLSQELVQVLARVPGTLHKIPSSQRGKYGDSDVYLQAFLRNRISGATRVSLQQILLKQTAFTPTSSGAGALYTLTATNAIESARAATINATGFVSNGNFNINKSH